MSTQSILFIGSYDGSKQMRLPADTTLEELVRNFGISRIRIPPVSYDELAEGEKAIELQTCAECGEEVLTTNMDGLCRSCEEEQIDFKQEMCTDCAGMKRLIIDGKEIPPRDWMLHGFACDIGCICQ